MALNEISLEAKILAELKRLGCDDAGAGSAIKKLSEAVAIAVIAEAKKADIVAPANGGKCTIS